MPWNQVKPVERLAEATTFGSKAFTSKIAGYRKDQEIE